MRKSSILLCLAASALNYGCVGGGGSDAAQSASDISVDVSSVALG